METVTLYRPTGPKEMELVKKSGFKRWPPRLPEQPIFYPVTNEEYAREIAIKWNIPASGVGYVTRFEVQKKFMDKYEIHQVGASHHTEWWIPAEDLEELNDHIVGLIEVIGEYRKDNREDLREEGVLPSTKSIELLTQTAEIMISLVQVESAHFTGAIALTRQNLAVGTHPLNSG